MTIYHFLEFEVPFPVNDYNFLLNSKVDKNKMRLASTSLVFTCVVSLLEAHFIQSKGVSSHQRDV